MLVERFCDWQPWANGLGATLMLHFTLSTWVPYYVVLMTCQFDVTF